MLFTTRSLRQLALLACSATMLILAGCGIGVVSTSTSGTLNMTGRVHGGVQPITGASIQLFATGAGGNGSQATSLLTTPVYTNAQSYFSLTGDYSCPSASSQVYLVARGGNPGYTGTVNNHALVLLSALGSCGDLISSPNRFIQLNEVSTVAAAYALAPFISAYDHVGASATNATGIANAFLDAQLLADTSTGTAAALPANLSIERDKLYALADVIVPCINSDGGSACTPLFSAATLSGGSAPTDVLSALLNIVKHPENNVASVFNCIPALAPYPTGLASAPNDWSMSLTITGGGINQPTTVAIDKFGNAWVANYGDSLPVSGLVAFSPQGIPFAGSPFGVGIQTESYSMALDMNGNPWVLSKEGNNTAGGVGSVALFTGAQSATPGTLTGIYSDSSLYYPQSIAADNNGSGTIIIGSYARGHATIYDLNGNFIKTLAYNPATLSGDSVFPIGVASDNNGGVWFADQGGSTVTHASASNVVNIVQNCCYAPQAVKLDRHANVWITNYDAVGFGANAAYTFSEVAPDGTILISKMSTAGLNVPGGAAVDAAGNFWVDNFYDGTISEIAGNDTSVPAGTALTPFALGKDSSLFTPFSITPDASGNLWIANQAGDSLTMFFGLATPTATPVTNLPTAP